MNLPLFQRKTERSYTWGSVFILLVVAGCSHSVTTSTSKVQDAKPAWLAAKPTDAAYYIGVGHATKQATNNYIQEAKKSALEDLVSEIKVEVASSSLLTQIDQNKQFQEKYQQIIQTKAADEIEEFEQVDSWQDGMNYWVYYRLSRQRYKEIKDAEKRDAVTLALDFFTKARESEKSEDIVEAIGFYFQGFRAIEKYLAEPIPISFEGKDILLTNEIYADLQQLLDRIEVSATPSEITINRRMPDNGRAITARAFLKSTHKPVPNLPLRATFEKGAGNVFPDYKTDDNGQTKILLTKISARDLEQTLGINVNLLASGADSTGISAMVARKMTVSGTSIVLKVLRPLVLITSVEKNFGMDRTNPQLTNRLKNYITNSGFEITNDKARAELWMDVTANSEKGAVSGNIFITYVTAVIRVVTVKDNREIYSTTLDRVKGYSLDYDRSSQESYNKSMDILEKEKMPQLIDAILQ